MHTLHALHIQAKDLKISENHKEPRMKRSHKKKKKKKKEKEKEKKQQQQQTTKD